LTWQGGYCCALSEKCPKPPNGLCSNDNPKAPAFFKYLACPNEHECGRDKIINTPISGTNFLEILPESPYKFNNGDVCSYIFEPPTGMGEWDKFYIQLVSVENAHVFIVKSPSYRYFDHLDKYMRPGDLIDTKRGWKFYVIAYSNGDLHGAFRIKSFVSRGSKPKIPERLIKKEE